MSENHLPPPTSPANRAEIIIAIEAYQGTVGSGLPSTQPDLDALCAATDRIVVWADTCEKLPISASPLNDYKELVLDFIRLPEGNPDSPQFGKLVESWGKADGTAGRLIRWLNARQGKRVRMRREVADEKAKELAKKMGRAFFLLSENAQAELIGCVWRTWSRTPFFLAAKKKRERLNRSPNSGKPAGSPPTVSLTNGLEAVVGEGEKNGVLKKLIDEQNADSEPSPLDPQPKKVYFKKRL